jgi:hypothetical protein
MSPARQELVSNRPLRGDELQKIIEADVHDVLSRDCMMTSRVAYGRVSYELRVILHLDNPAFKESTSVIRSHPASDNQVEAQPELSALESHPPLSKPISEDAYVSATQRDRTIDSPNVARIEHGLPISVVRQGRDTGGNAISVEEGVLYPKETVQDVVVPPEDHDLTRMVKKAFDSGDNLL